MATVAHITTDFEPGLYMKVPKGTELLHSRWDTKVYGDPTKREVTVEISDVFLPNPEGKLTQDEINERTRRLQVNRDIYLKAYDDTAVEVHYPAVNHPASRGVPAWTQQAYTRDEIPEDKKEEWRTFTENNHDEQIAIQEEYKNLGISRFTIDDLIVAWSKGSNVTWAKNVTLVEKPEARKKQPKVNLRQQMVPKSRWKFTKDLDLFYGAPNPAYHAAIKAWDKANPRPQWPHNTPDADRPKQEAIYQAWDKAHTASRKAAKDSVGEFIPTLYRSFKAGEIFTVTGKFLSYWMPHGWDGERYGNVAPALFDGETDELGLEYSLIKDAIEAESIPVVKAFVLRHRETGLYYETYAYSEEATKALQEKAREEGQTGLAVRRLRAYEAYHADTFMKGKKWDNIGKAKTSILMMTGYYEGLPGADEALPDWSGGEASMTADDLRNYDLVEFNKLDRSETGVVADFRDWFERSWQLRELTMKYGSSVRQVYKALEKAKMLDTHKGVAVFTVTDEDAFDNVGYWGDRTALTDADKAEIKLALASVEGKFKQAIDHKSAAVSFPNKGAAMMFKLAYYGKLKVSIIDLEDMKEAVGDNG